MCKKNRISIKITREVKTAINKNLFCCVLLVFKKKGGGVTLGENNWAWETHIDQLGLFKNKAHSAGTGNSNWPSSAVDPLKQSHTVILTNLGWPDISWLPCDKESNTGLPIMRDRIQNCPVLTHCHLLYSCPSNSVHTSMKLHPCTVKNTKTY